MKNEDFENDSKWGGWDGDIVSSINTPRVSGSILSSSQCLYGVSHVLPMFPLVSSHCQKHVNWLH